MINKVNLSEYLGLTPDKSVEDIISLINDCKSVLNDLKQDYSLSEYSKVKKEQISSFFKSIDTLDKPQKVYLKRSMGAKYSVLDGLYSIYCLNTGLKMANEYEKKIWSLCARIYCYMGESTSLSFESQLSSVLISNSSISRFEYFLNSKFAENNFEYLNKELISYVRMLKAKGKAFNCEKLLFDLLHWGNSSKYIQLNWANTFYSLKNNKEN